MKTDGWTDRQSREDVAVAGTMILADGSWQDVMIDNLSDEGCRIIGTLGIGDPVTLELPERGRVVGQVRWAIGGRSGIRFGDA